MSVNYTPSFLGYSGQGSFRYWCQVTLPLVYDDSLSYYELLNKVVNYLNNVISDVSNVETNLDSLLNAYNQLQSYVNAYFDNLDVQNEINNKLDSMAESGELSQIFEPLVSDAVGDWLSDHITPTSPAVDNSLSVSGAAADSKTVGDKFSATFMTRANLSDGDDLDDLTAIGAYFKGNNVSLVNEPSGVSGIGRVLVISNNSLYAIIQVYLASATNGIYCRQRNTPSGSWSSWEKIADSSDISDTVSAINSSISSLENISLCTRTSLANNDDLDDFNKIGTYYKNYNVNVLNSPVEDGTTGRLIVVSNNSDYANIQFYYNTYDDELYFRSKNNPSSTWGTWNKVAVKSDVDSVENTLTTLDNGVLKFRPQITNGYDMNNLMRIGTYYKGYYNDVVNGAYSSHCFARITVLSGTGTTQDPTAPSEYGLTQIWENMKVDSVDGLGNPIGNPITLDNETIWIRTKPSPDFGWGNWRKIERVNRYSVIKPPDKVAGVYSNLARLVSIGGGRLTYSSLTDVLDTDVASGEDSTINKMRLYHLNVTRKHMETGNGGLYDIVDGSAYPKPKILIIGCQHGNEKSAAVVITSLIEHLLFDESYKDIAENYDWYFVPIVNIYGYNHNTRNNEDGVNINRDYDDTSGFDTVEAQAIRTLYRNHHFSMFLDLHNKMNNLSNDTDTAAYQLGFISIPNFEANKLNDYKRIWGACDEAGRAAELWARTCPESKKTSQPLTFVWGDYLNPSIYNNSVYSAAAYFRGNYHTNDGTPSGTPTGGNLSVSTYGKTFCSGTVECNWVCNPITYDVDIPFNTVAMEFINTYVQNIVLSLSRTVFNFLDPFN